MAGEVKPASTGADTTEVFEPATSAPPHTAESAAELWRMIGVGTDATAGRAMLAEMIEQLPSEPAPRVAPADIQLEGPVVAPVAVWFWGDDDIYPGAPTR